MRVRVVIFLAFILMLLVAGYMILVFALPKEAYIVVKVYREGVLKPGAVYLRALYPQGFKFIGGGYAKNGVYRFKINVGELASAWAGDRRGTIPTFLITVFTEDGYAETKAVNIEWIKLTPLSVNTFTLEPKNKRKRFLRIQEGASCQSMTCPETYGCDYCAVMVDTFEYSGRVLLMKAVTNENSSADMSYSYHVDKKAGFSIAVTFFSTEVWEIAGYTWYSRSGGGSAADTPGRGETGYISMVMYLRYEKWCFYSNFQLEDEEVVIYAVDFDPNTLTNKPGYQVPVNQWTNLGTYTSTDPLKPIYVETEGELGSGRIAVDIKWFINKLISLAKLPAWAQAAANFASLFLAIKIIYQNVYAFSYSIFIHGDAGTTHTIQRATHHFPNLNTPALYYKTTKV